MSIPSNHEGTQSVKDPKSQFTYRDLHLLSQYSTATPLRVIALVDYDAFYAQCETVRLKLPDTQPLAVQQWHHIIALNYAGRGFGFKRGATAVEAKRLCPNIVLQHVATWREGDSSWAYRDDAANLSNMKTDKAALDPYRIQSRKSLEVIKSTLPPPPLQRIEKASIDEVFLDLSAQVHSILLLRFPELSLLIDAPEARLSLPPSNSSLDWKSHLIEKDDNASDVSSDWDEVALHIGAEIISDLRGVIHDRMGYTCSAGVGHNKALAKLAAGDNKPNKQTVVRSQAVSRFLSSHKMTSIRGLAGKLGAEAMEKFGSDDISTLLNITLEQMKAELGLESGTWLYDMLRGKENSEVTARTDLQSMLSQKTFAPPLKDIEQACNWVRIFVADLVGRINDLEVETGHRRRPTVVSVHHHIKGRFGPTRSKQTTIPRGSPFTEHTLFSACRQLLEQISCDGPPTWPCQSIGISVHKFESLVARNERITSFFARESNSDDQKRKREDQSVEERKSTEITRKRRGEFFIIEGRSTPYEVSVSRSKEVADEGSTDIYNCPKCSKDIDAFCVLEHLDWHCAIELQANEP